MKLTVLVDNNTIIDQYYYGEPGVSYFIQDGNTTVLFDAGYSNLFTTNANLMGIDLGLINQVVLSHGHNDHTGGLTYFTPAGSTTINKNHQKVQLIAHPDVFLPRRENNLDIGSPVEELSINAVFDFSFTTEPVWLTDHLVFLGEIPRTNSFENKEPVGQIKKNNKWSDDYLIDDSALVYNSEEGLFIITGCSHAGICNTIDHAIQVCGETRIAGIIGGFHLINPTPKQVTGTLKYFTNADIAEVYPCHCTALKFKIELANIATVKEVGVGLELIVR